LETLGNGDAIAQVDHQIKEAIKNVLDPNTKAEAPRQVNLKITIVPNHDRSEAQVKYQATAKLAPDAEGKDQLFFNQKGNAFVHKGEQLPLTVDGPENAEDSEKVAQLGGDSE